MLLPNLLRAQSLKSFNLANLNDKPDKVKHFRNSRAATVRLRAVSRYWRRLRPDGKNQSGDVALSRQCVLFVRSYKKVFRLLNRLRSRCSLIEPHPSLSKPLHSLKIFLQVYHKKILSQSKFVEEVIGVKSAALKFVDVLKLEAERNFLPPKSGLPSLSLKVALHVG